MIDARQSSVTAAQRSTAVVVAVVTQVDVMVQSPNNTATAENMATDWHAHVVPIRVTLPWERCRCTLRGQSPSPYELLVTITHTHTTVLRPSGARRELLDFIVHGKINRGRHTDYPAGHHSVRTNRCPPPPSPNGGGGHWNRKPKSGNNKSGQNCPNTWQ